MSDYTPVYIYFVLTLAIVAVMTGLSALFSAKRSTPVKFLPYESGIQTETHLLEQRFPIRHYLVAIIFLVFDIEVIFLYPWAVSAKSLGPFAFFEMAFFLAALFIGFAYVWKKGGLDWQ